jgi:hypothetical protein
MALQKPKHVGVTSWSKKLFFCFYCVVVGYKCFILISCFAVGGGGPPNCRPPYSSINCNSVQWAIVRSLGFRCFWQLLTLPCACGRRHFFSLSFRLAVHYVRTRLLFLADNMHEHSFTFLICLQQTSDKKKLLRVFHANRLIYYFTIPICRLSHERQFPNLNFLVDVTTDSLVHRYQRLAGHCWFHRLGR